MPTCKRTAEIMRLMVTNQKHTDAAALIDEVRAVGHKLQQAKPSELAIGNIVRRVLHIIREEVQQEASEAGEEPAPASVRAWGKGFASCMRLLHASGRNAILFSHAQGPGMMQSFRAPGPGRAALSQNRPVSLSNLLDVGIAELDEMIGQQGGDKHEAVAAEAFETESHASVTKRKVKSLPQWKRKTHIIEAINELIEELENIQQSITIQGVEHIHAKEVCALLGDKTCRLANIG